MRVPNIGTLSHLNPFDLELEKTVNSYNIEELILDKATKIKIPYAFYKPFKLKVDIKLRWFINYTLEPFCILKLFFNMQDSSFY